MATTKAQKRAEEAARIKAENEARKARTAETRSTVLGFQQQAKAAEATAVSAISGGDASPATLEKLPAVNLQQFISQSLAPAFIPARTVVDATGTAVVVDINGRDSSGKLVQEQTDAQAAAMETNFDADIEFLDTVIQNVPALAAGTVPTITTGMTSPKATTSIEVIKAALRAVGLKGNIVDSGAVFVQTILDEIGDVDNAVDIFLENKEYTLKNGNKIESPFYKEYGFLNEYAPEKKSAGELFGFVTGMENLVKKYNISSKFASREKLIEATKNDVSVSDLDKRANIARLKGITADPVYVDALRRLGYIRNAEDLTDFYLDTTVGIEEFENRRRTAYLSTEALRRASSGITIDTARMQQLASTLGAQGYTAEGVEREAVGAYETISQQLPELTRLSGIFERGGAAKPTDIQQELESEQLLGMASQRRKRLEQSNIDIFRGKAGRAYTESPTAGLV